MRRQSVTMRELQKMSAGAIQALPHPVPIKSGSATIGLLVPVKKPDLALLAEVNRSVHEKAAELSPETRERIDRYFGEQGI